MKSLKYKLRTSTPELIYDLIDNQIKIAEESRKRINKEGIVVRDLKGSVIPHPAIKIEQESIKIISDMIIKYK